jgi:PAS domain S-box-containing protein
MNMKRILLLAIFLIAAILPARNAPLRLGIYDNPPLTFLQKGAPSGFIVDIIGDFCRSRGIELQFVQAPFHELFEKLRRDEVDVIAPIAFSEERSRFLRYNSESVLIDWSNVIIGDGENMTLLGDLDGKRIGIVNGDHYAELFKRDLQLQKIACVFIVFDDFVQIVSAVDARRVDAGFIGRFSLSYILKSMPRIPKIKVMPGSYYHEPLFFGVNPRQGQFASQLDAYLRQAKVDPHGRLNRAYEHWFGQTYFQKRLIFLSKNYLWILLAVLATITLFIVFNAMLRSKVRKSVREIARQKSYFENLFKIIPAGIVILDEEDRVIDTNQEFHHLFGFSLDEIKGRRLTDLINTADTLPQAVSLVRKAQSGERVFADGRRRNKYGEMLDLHIIASPIVYAGRVQGIIGIFLDISERKRMEEEIIKSKNIESVGVLAGGIAHDFNNMLTGILGNISVARRLTPDEPARDILEKAEKAALKASGLTQQLLTFSKGGYPVKKVVSLPNLVRDALDLVISGSNVRADLRVDDGVSACEVDVTQLVQVIHNLLLNAREAMPGGGIVDIRIGTHVQAGEDDFLRQGNYVFLAIRDHGPGIAAADLQRIFVPYFTTKKTGSGLGLAIAYSIVNKHNGYIKVDSSDGAGATFTVFLPASPKKISPEAKTPRSAERQARILLMDDEEIVREVFADMLQDTPYRVDLASVSGEALEKFIAARDAGVPYDLVFLDLTGPGDIGGIKTLERIRSVDPQVTAIAISGYSVSEVSSHPGRFHFSDFLAKPFLPDELLNIISRNLSSKS